MLTTSYVPGVPIWLDLAARDIDGAAEFYRALFGWDFAPQGAEAGGYGLLRLDGGNVAGVGPLSAEDAEPSWEVYFHSHDVEETASVVEQAGGGVRFAPFDVFALGRMAGFTDPTGAHFSVWQPGENRGLDAVGDPYTLCWTELYTTDAAEARQFYGSVFGWELWDTTVGNGTTYTLVARTGGERGDTHGGIMQLPEGQLRAGSRWYPYFEVPDCDATLATGTAHGASVIVPATDMPGVGRMAALKDPAGAAFAVVTSE
ncbi:VOC family protein [Streptomyces oceani]|uniref:Hydroxylase n=1 Tax=Streptomyces oceani TaxID=1075402 RepID=A0A1E7JX25_9ACTN|nr:VOC family protein [Streptomyces oceani]OEU96185.1 hydroxylase [Streptomyces oceani]